VHRISDGKLAMSMLFVKNITITLVNNHTDVVFHMGEIPYKCGICVNYIYGEQSYKRDISHG